jgi:hypothetical protein
VSSVQFSAANNNQPVSYSEGGAVMPFQKLASGFQGVNEHGVPIPINPGRLNFDPTQVRTNPNGGVTQRVIVGGNETSFKAIEDAPQRFQAADLKQGDGIVNSAIAAGGRHLASHELKPDSLVTITLSDGTTTDTTVATALRMGAIRKTTEGYEDVKAPAAAHNPAAQAPTATPDPIAQDVPVDEEWIGHTAAVQRGLPEVFVANVINDMVKTGSFSPEAMNAAAKHLGTTPEVVLGVFDGAMKAHGASYERYVSANGVRPADFTKFMASMPDTQALLMAKQASTGKTSVWAPMLRQFKATQRR